jgi:hypothetical protein
MHEGLDAMTENLLLLPSVNVCTACQGDCQSGRPIATNTNTVPRRMLSYSTNSYSNRTVRALEAERRRSSAPLKPYLLETRQPANPPSWCRLSRAAESEHAFAPFGIARYNGRPPLCRSQKGYSRVWFWVHWMCDSTASWPSKSRSEMGWVSDQRRGKGIGNGKFRYRGETTRCSVRDEPCVLVRNIELDTLPRIQNPTTPSNPTLTPLKPSPWATNTTPPCPPRET